MPEPLTMTSEVLRYAAFTDAGSAATRPASYSMPDR